MNYIKKYSVTQWIVIGILSLSIALLNILRVIIGYFQTPKDSTYLAVGHFYQDYFEYTQQIAQGIFGHAFIQNQFTPNDPTQTLIGWGQYLYIGKLANLFHLSPFSSYWITIFLLSLILCLLMFLVIEHLLPTQSFLIRISAFLFAVFATPFVQILTTSNHLVIEPYNFWYAPISLFHRIGGIPHHLSITICTLLSLMLLEHILSSVQKETTRNSIAQTILFISILLLLLTFGPLQVINILTSLIGVGLILMWKSYRKEKFGNTTKRLFIFLVLVGSILLPAALYIQHAHNSSELFAWVTAWEITQQNYPSLILVLLTIGPILLFIPFGVVSFFKKISLMRLLVLCLTLSSFFYAATPLAKLLGTFNLRFFSPVSYLLFGVMAVLGIQKISQIGPHKKFILYGLISGFLLYSIVVTLIILRSFGGVDPISYIPNNLLRGIHVLDQYPDTRGVMTSPAIALGMITPCIVDRNVYLGRMFFTPNFEEKQIISENFFQGHMSDDQAYALLKDNALGYVLLSSKEPYPKEHLTKYPFLKEIYANDALTIFQVQ